MCDAGAQGPGPWNHCMPSEVAFASMDLPRVWKKDAPVGLLLLSHSEGQGPEAERRGVVASGVYVRST